jgi:uncharacterized membrane protein YidH (DUF202 family)
MLPADSGLQPERTALAWSRTGLALLVNALVVLRSGWTSGQRWVLALGALLLLAAAATVLVGRWRARVLVQPGTPAAVPAGLMAAVVLVAWLACVAGVASLAAAQAAGP